MTSAWRCRRSLITRNSRSDCPAVAMVTASHNENGWTGVKMGASAPLTFGPDEINAIKEIVLNGKGKRTRRRHVISRATTCAKPICRR